MLARGRSFSRSGVGCWFPCSMVCFLSGLQAGSLGESHASGGIVTSEMTTCTMPMFETNKIAALFSRVAALLS